MISGNQIQAQTQYGQGLATQNLQNYLGQLNTMSGQGVSAASGIAQPNTTGANNAGNDIMGAGTAQGAGALGIAGAGNQTLTNYLANYKQMSGTSYGSGGGGGATSLSPSTGTGLSLSGTGGLY
jgi:hypothetical protein